MKDSIVTTMVLLGTALLAIARDRKPEPDPPNPYTEKPASPDELRNATYDEHPEFKEVGRHSLETLRELALPSKC